MSLPDKHPIFKLWDRVVLLDYWNNPIAADDTEDSPDCEGIGTILKIEPFYDHRGLRSKQYPWIVSVRFDTCRCIEDFPGCNGWPVNKDGTHYIHGSTEDLRQIKLWQRAQPLDNRFTSIVEEL